MRINVEVTAEDIKRGIKVDCLNCPIALALDRCGQPDASVSDSDVEIDGRFIRMPLDARRFVQDFDDGKPVEPFAFELTDEDGP